MRHCGICQWHADFERPYAEQRMAEEHPLDAIRLSYQTYVLQTHHFRSSQGPQLRLAPILGFGTALSSPPITGSRSTRLSAHAEARSRKGKLSSLSWSFDAFVAQRLQCRRGDQDVLLAIDDLHSAWLLLCVFAAPRASYLLRILPPYTHRQPRHDHRTASLPGPTMTGLHILPCDSGVSADSSLLPIAAPPNGPPDGAGFSDPLRSWQRLAAHACDERSVQDACVSHVSRVLAVRRWNLHHVADVTIPNAPFRVLLVRVCVCLCRRT